MEKQEIKKLASKILNYSLKLNPKEHILVEMIGEESKILGLELIKQAEQIGAYPHLNLIDKKVLKEFLMNSSSMQIKKFGQNDLHRMKNMEAYVGINSQTDSSIFNDVPVEKMELYNKYYMKPVHFEERVKNKKWCILRYPTEYLARKYNITLKEFEEFYFKVCNLDYKKMSNSMNVLKNMLSKTDNVHIVGDGTDLTFSVKGIKAEKYDGTFNLPDGEVATAPVKNSVNGYITYNTKTFYNGIEFENIKFEFKDGKIVKATANRTKELNEILDMDEGARYIGEFAIGLNPFIKNPMGDTLFDEKIMGSFHFTPGQALEESDNGNRSAIHWDIVNIQTPEYGGGKIYFDNHLIRKDGRFVLLDLSGLNPENLV